MEIFKLIVPGMVIGVIVSYFTSQYTIRAYRKNLIFNEEKEALFLFYSSYKSWQNSLLSISFERYTHRTYLELNDLDDKLEEESNKVEIDLAKLTLFVGNDDVVKRVVELMGITTEVQTLTSKYLDNLYNALEDGAEVLIDLNVKMNDFYNELSILNKERPDIREQIEKEWNDFHNKRKTLFERIYQTEELFTERAKKYIRSI